MFISKECICCWQLFYVKMYSPGVTTLPDFHVKSLQVLLVVVIYLRKIRRKFHCFTLSHATDRSVNHRFDGKAQRVKHQRKKKRHQTKQNKITTKEDPGEKAPLPLLLPPSVWRALSEASLPLRPLLTPSRWSGRQMGLAQRGSLSSHFFLLGVCCLQEAGVLSYSSKKKVSLGRARLSDWAGNLLNLVFS